jgi:hypothetical protein
LSQQAPLLLLRPPTAPALAAVSVLQQQHTWECGLDPAEAAPSRPLASEGQQQGQNVGMGASNAADQGQQNKNVGAPGPGHSVMEPHSASVSGGKVGGAAGGASGMNGAASAGLPGNGASGSPQVPQQAPSDDTAMLPLAPVHMPHSYEEACDTLLNHVQVRRCEDVCIWLEPPLHGSARLSMSTSAWICTSFNEQVLGALAASR